MSVEEKFKEHKLVPDVLKVAPPEIAEVEYISGKKCELGNELTPTEAKDLPKVTWNADPDAFYTLVMTDPDAPNPENPWRREWKHWLVCNIPGCSVGEGLPMAMFIPSGPPKGSPHRYTFIVYKQPNKIDNFGEASIGWSVDGRAGWNTQEFANRFNFGNQVELLTGMSI